MYVCICAAVSEPEVRECILAGARTAEDIGDHCAAGTGCGSCVERLGRLVAQLTGEFATPERAA
jgi:bacterioferritin-associated ferredoxin